jgi:riboflavin biosynthesis pyrimidine reductase
MNRSLMAAGLVDRVQLTIFPVISGRTGTNRVHTMVPPARQQSGHRRDRGADVVVGHVAEDAAEQQEVGGHGAQVGRRGSRVAAHHGDRG